jgi:hypothetical protein
MAPPADGGVDRIERLLLQHSVVRLEAGRDSCVDCGRTPLVGEQVHLYEHVSGFVCELCSARRRDRALARQLVCHFEQGQTVRVMGVAR